MSEPIPEPPEGTDSDVQIPAAAFEWIYDPNAPVEVDDEVREDVPQVENPEDHPDNAEEGFSDDVPEETIDREIREGLV